MPGAFGAILWFLSVCLGGRACLSAWPVPHLPVRSGLVRHRGCPPNRGPALLSGLLGRGGGSGGLRWLVDRADDERVDRRGAPPPSRCPRTLGHPEPPSPAAPPPVARDEAPPPSRHLRLSRS